MLVQWTNSAGTSLGNIVYRICQALAGRISFGQTTNNKDTGQNIAGVWVTGTIGSANTPQVFNLTPVLDHTPIGFIVILTDKACSLYATPTDQSAWVPGQITVESSVADVAVTLFVL